MSPGTHTSWTLMFWKFHEGLMTIPDQFGVYLEIIKRLNDCMAIWENVDVPIFEALFCVLYYVRIDSIYLPGIPWCETQEWSFAHLLSPIFTPKRQCFIGPGPFHIPDQAPFLIWAKAICHSLLSGSWILNDFGHAYLSIILSVLVSKMGSRSMSQDFSVTVVSGFGFPLMVAHKPVDCCLGLCLSYHV